MVQALGVAGVAALAVLGLVAANVLRDRGVEAAVTRRVAAVLGGGVYLIAVLCLEVWVAVALSTAVALVVLGLRLSARGQLRGLTGAATSARWGEVAYPLAGAASLAIGWGLLGDRWLAFLPIAFMAWGDNAAGAVRAVLPSGQRTSIWPSAAMLTVGLAAAALHQPYGVGAAGAVAATVAERLQPTTHPLWDDNWVIVAAALVTMHLATALGG
jgi:dolichol kinase